MKQNIWPKLCPKLLLHRGTIFGPNIIPNRKRNWMCRRLFSMYVYIDQPAASFSSQSMNVFLKRRLHIQFLLRFGIIFGPNIVPLCSKSLGQSLGQIFCSIEGQFLAQIKYQIVEQIGCFDAA